MRSQFGRNGGPGGPDVGEVVGHVSETLRRNLGRFVPIFIGIILIGLILSGVYFVEPGEQGVVRTFGRETTKTSPGPHFAIPFIQQVDVINIEKVRRIEVGFRGKERVPHEALMITGDENIVEAQLIVQYRILDPSKTLFRLRAPEETLHATAEVALRAMVGRTKIDDVLTTGREKVQDDTRAWLQTLMDNYDSGLAITEVKLHVVDAPDEVRDAFHDVVRAREEKEKVINQAKGYMADVIPRARGESERIQREAEGYKEQRVLRATGDASKFESVLTEYKKAEAVTRQRLYLETMERILSQAKNKTLIDGNVANGALPVLPLGTGGMIPGRQP